MFIFICFNLQRAYNSCFSLEVDRHLNKSHIVGRTTDPSSNLSSDHPARHSFQFQIISTENFLYIGTHFNVISFRNIFFQILILNWNLQWFVNYFLLPSTHWGTTDHCFHLKIVNDYEFITAVFPLKSIFIHIHK